MPFDIEHARANLKSFRLKHLFIEDMGWDQASRKPLNVAVQAEHFILTPIAEKRGLVAYQCSPLGSGEIPLYTDRRKIETQVRKYVHEHIIVFANNDGSRQIWQWVRRAPGRPTTAREVEYTIRQKGELLLQRLQNLVFSLDTEAETRLGDVTRGARAAFDVERVTRSFYDKFRKEHTDFAKFLKGIPDDHMQRWYVSVTLNRLMFVYFIQKKGFLNNDLDYLRTKLGESKAEGKDLFYRKFLCPLFFEGFATREEDRTAKARKLFGAVPYLNGGIFQPHQIERAHGKTIQIEDKAFKQLFDFFDNYRWHLDERPLREDDEINPDVLGYIFEKYINQKEMGAYYTKEDITNYIGRSTILPYLLDQARQDCTIAFTGPAPVWNLLASDPRRYIFPSVQKGCELELPAVIQAGIADVAKRADWNKTADEQFALPTETWREVVTRRQHYQEVHDKLAAGKVQDVNELVTLNLDIQQFTQDVVENSEGPELLRAFWKALENIKVLDPTCGSGAFLFAALNILEPLYEACLDRMRSFRAELPAVTDGTEKYTDFAAVIKRMERHSNEEYFILKSIIVNNLYGVDIMEEAVEICKLRLFLKLIAQVSHVEDVEPLPDIDFNVVPGNTLVGFANITEVEQSMNRAGQQARLLGSEGHEQVTRIKQQLISVGKAYKEFQKKQLQDGASGEEKALLVQGLNNLNSELSGGVAIKYGVAPTGTKYKEWLESHKPFHWLTSFYSIMERGGFDVIVGNPPYLEYSRLRQSGYSLLEYQTLACGNLYAFVIERVTNLLKQDGALSFIVQLPLVCTDRMIPAQTLLSTQYHRLWFANFDDRPAKLFDGLQNIRATIFMGRKGSGASVRFATRYNRWYSTARAMLFEGLVFYDISWHKSQGSFPKLSGALAGAVLQKLRIRSKLGNVLGAGSSFIYYHNAPRYWIRAMNFTPYFWGESEGARTSSHVKSLKLADEQSGLVAVAALNSSLFYFWFITFSNCRDLSLREIEDFPLGLSDFSSNTVRQLSDAALDLMKDYRKHAVRRELSYAATGQVKYDEFYPKHSKQIIDRIDALLAPHYGLTAEEAEFITNFDIGFRMGGEDED